MGDRRKKAPEKRDRKEALCSLCKAPLDMEICYSIVDHWPHMSLEDILPGGQCEFLNWEACPNAGDDLHLKANLARKINHLKDFCSICGHKVRSKGDYTWLDYPRTAKAVEELLSYQVHIKHVHHISYNPEVKIDVCDSCHAKIHNTDDVNYSKYRPKQRKSVPLRLRLHHEHSIENAIRYRNCFYCKNLDDTCEGGNSQRCGAFEIGMPATKGKVLHGSH